MMKTIPSWEDENLETETIISGMKSPFLIPVPNAGRPGNALFREGDFNRQIIESLPGLFYVMDQHLQLVLWNDNFRTVSGCSNEELQGMSVLKFHEASQRSITAEELIRIFRLGEFAVESDIAFKDGMVRTFFFNFKRMVCCDAPCLAATAIDVSRREKTNGRRVHFPIDPEQMNVSPRVHIRSEKEGDKAKATEDKLKVNLQDLVIPHLKKLKASNLNAAQRKHLKALEDSLKDVLSPFVTSLLLTYSNLTPQEIQIADLVRSGNGTKEIADLLNTSVNTIATHRNNIRKKLDLRNTKVNLRTHLQSIL